MGDRNDPELKYLSVERNQFNDPASQAEWTQKRLVWVPHETQVNFYILFSFILKLLPYIQMKIDYTIFLFYIS